MSTEITVSQEPGTDVAVWNINTRLLVTRQMLHDYRGDPLGLVAEHAQREVADVLDTQRRRMKPYPMNNPRLSDAWNGYKAGYNNPTTTNSAQVHYHYDAGEVPKPEPEKTAVERLFEEVEAVCERGRLPV